MKALNSTLKSSPNFDLDFSDQFKAGLLYFYFFPVICSFLFDAQVSAFLEIHDIAGLVRGAHEGQGLGNNFLSHIRAVDGIFHVLRKIIIHVYGVKA